MWPRYPIIALPSLVCSLVALVFVVLLWRRRGRDGASYLLVLVGALCLWAFAEANELRSPAVTTRIWWTNVRFLCSSTIPCTWLYFALRFSNGRQWRMPRYLMLLPILPAAHILMVWTNGMHHLVWTKFWLLEEAGFTVMATERGPWYWTIPTTAYCFLLAGGLVLALAALRSNRMYRRQMTFLLVSALVPMAANAVFMLRLSPMPHLDLTPISFTVVAVLQAWNFLRYGLLFPPVPVAREQIMQSMKDGVIVFDLGHRVVDLNGAARRMIGRAYAEVLNRDVNQWFHVPKTLFDNSGHEEYAAHAKQLPDGTTRHVEISLSALHTRMSGVVGGVMIVRDVTEKLALQAQMQRARQLEGLSVVAAGVAHDFNNLLSVIGGNTEMALHEVPPDSPSRECLEEVGPAVERASTLCRRMLACSGRQLLSVQHVDLNGVIRPLEAFASDTLPDHVTLECRLDDSIPPIEGDASQLQQILNDLIANASEAMDGKAGHLVIATGSGIYNRDYLQSTLLDSGHGDGCYVYLEVSDDGCGMDPETMEKAFTPFFSTKFLGRGLGLPAVLGIVQSHKGAVKIDSQPGKGTVVRCLFPAAE